MNYAIIIISTLFICIAFILTVRNAKFLLAGYNTMSNQEREKVDIKGLVTYYKRFFAFLGLSFLLIGLGFYYYFNTITVTVFVCVYPVVASIYLLVYSKKFYSKSSL